MAVPDGATLPPLGITRTEPTLTTADAPSVVKTRELLRGME